MRRSFAVLAVAAMVLAVMCGAAFADASEVVQKVNDYGLTGTASGSTVTITGNKSNANTMLDLGDISGLTIDWQATLTYLPNTLPELAIFIINAIGNGAFKMTGGKIEILPSTSRGEDQNVWVFHGFDVEEVSLLGGEISGDHLYDSGFDIGSADDSKRWAFKIDGAAIKLNRYISSDSCKFIKGDTSKVTGVVCSDHDGESVKADVFGKGSFGLMLMSVKDEDVSTTVHVNNGAEVDLDGADMTGRKRKLNFIVDGSVDIRGMTGTIVDITINAGGEAIIAEDSKVTLFGGTVKRVALAGSGVSAAAAGESGKLMVRGSLTIPDGGKLTIEDIASLTKDPSATLDVKGKIELPSGTSPEQMKKLATDLGITGSVFEMDGKTYDDQGEETTGGGSSSGSSSGGACASGAAALVALAALAMIKRRMR